MNARIAGKQPAQMLWVGLLTAACTGLAGCAGPMDALDARNAVPEFREPGMSVQAAKDVVLVGQSTKADVAAALGQGTVVRFDSGYEVWVYRAKAYKPAVDAPGTTEFIVLFSPSGVVKKTRIRPA
jgi:hypothetical protein